MDYKDLKSGMLLEFSDGKRAIFLKDTESGDVITGGHFNAGEGTWMCINADFFPNISPTVAVIKIWGRDTNMDILKNKTEPRKLLYQREENIYINLNSEYTAEISKRGKVVNVGCQTIPFSKIEEIYKAIHK